MSWDDERFERFVDATARMARGELPGYGYSHVLLPYAPADERFCIERLRGHFRTQLERQGFASEPIAVAPLVAQAASRYTRRELHDANDYRLLERTLAGTLIAETAAAISQRASDLAPATIPILCRLGALYPFGQVSSLLLAVHTAGVRQTIAVAYPGTADGMMLRFLGRNDPTGGYRGHIVT